MTHAPAAVGTVGLIENRPNSRNVVPGEVFFTVDFRHPDEAVLDVMEGKFRAALPEILAPMGLEPARKSASGIRRRSTFDPELIACVRQGAEQAGFPMRDMVSGAGHDAAYIARVAPTTMIFVPCLGGISHNESENRRPSTNAPPARRCCSTPCSSMIAGWGEAANLHGRSLSGISASFARWRNRPILSGRFPWIGIEKAYNASGLAIRYGDCQRIFSAIASRGARELECRSQISRTG